MSFRVTNFVREGRRLKVFVRDCAYKKTFHIRYDVNARREVVYSGGGGIPSGMRSRFNKAQDHAEDFLSERNFTVVDEDEWLEVPWIAEGTGINTASTGVADYLEQMDESQQREIRDWLDEQLDGDSE